MSDRIDSRFRSLRARGRRALVTYITAGYPDRARSIELMRGVVAAGADIVEVGVPFSDPLADGPVIQASSQRALAMGMTLEGVLNLVREAEVPVPVVLFGYLNPILAAGPEFPGRARDAGCDGLLVTDLPVGADPLLEQRLAATGLAFIRLVAPTTPERRVREIARAGSGFVYLISRLGVTGERGELDSALPDTVARVRAAASLPVCVGFGISTPAQAARVAAIADGVVVGTALVRAAERGVDHAVALVREMREAMDAAAPVAA